MWQFNEEIRVDCVQVVEQDRIRITLDGLDNKVVNLNVGRHRHPVNEDTIVEWVSENGERTITNGVQGIDSCWYSGWVEDESNSSVTLGICQGDCCLFQMNSRFDYIQHGCERSFGYDPLPQRNSSDRAID